MDHALAPHRLKLARARDHLMILAAEVLKVRGEPTPAQRATWALIAGDVVRNARTALDLCVVAAVRAGRPDASAHHAHLPIGRDEAAFRRAWPAASRGMSSEARAAFEALRPWEGGDHRLAMLRVLDQADRHGLLLPVDDPVTGELALAGFPMFPLLTELCAKVEQVFDAAGVPG